MPDKLRFCPKCNAPAEFRLGEWECPSCGYILPREQPCTAASAQPEERNDGINRAKLLIPAEPPSAPAYPSYQLRSVREPAVLAPNLQAEKVLFLTVFFVVSLGSGLLGYAHLYGASALFGGLLGLIAGSLFGTVAVGFVLYFDMDCIRTTCMWSLGIITGLSIVAVALAIPSGMFKQTLPGLPMTLMSAWLVAILWRDHRSED